MFYKLLRLIRYFSNLPAIFFLELGSFYSKIIKFIDYKNYEVSWEDQLQKKIDKKKGKKIFITKKEFISFFTPTTISSYRSKTFFSKEPDTIKWLNNKGKKNKVLFDIGGNMGIYSIYFTKKFSSFSYIFEPSFKNLNLIERNIALNNLNEKITVIPNPVYKKNIVSKLFQLENNVAGSATTTFDDQVVKNKITNLLKKRSQMTGLKVLSFSIDNLVKNKIIKKPDLIKIDVDGNEYDVILGAQQILKASKNLSLLIEIQSYNKNKTLLLLKKLGFKILSSRGKNFILEKK